jgi:carbamoyltransferase
MPSRILGISAFYHDSAAALIIDGHVAAAAQEERFTRIKHDARFPTAAIRYCLGSAGLKASDLDQVVFYEKPFIKFERLLETYLAFAPKGFNSFRLAIPLWLKEKLFQKRLLQRGLKDIDPDLDWEARLLFTDHHQSHAASAFFASPFDEAAVLTVDGVGEWATTTSGFGQGNKLDITREIQFPHSIGLLYSAFTYYTGFKVNSGEYKVMGLAPYGEPKYLDEIFSHLVDLKEDGSYRLDLRYFNYCNGLTMTAEPFHNLFGGEPRTPEESLNQRHMDLAASIQKATEEITLRLAQDAARRTGSSNLCLAGGVALNCVANGKMLRDGTFKNIWVQPAAGDAGGALGAALAAYHQFNGAERRPNGITDSMSGSYLGPAYGQADIEGRLRGIGARFATVSDQDLISGTVQSLVDQKAVGWFQGRMEFGPRALGARSILGDPRSPRMQKSLNLRVKYRESFRPFAPAVLREDVADWFDLSTDSPYMLLVADVAEQRRRSMTAAEQALFGIDKLNVSRSEIPAVTHVDYSARIQTVHAETNPRFHALIAAFKAQTGCPVLVNTSFNVRGEPIVCTPEDAFRCFMGSDIEVLAIGNCLLHKEEQDPALKIDYSGAFELD